MIARRRLLKWETASRQCPCRPWFPRHLWKRSVDGQAMAGRPSTAGASRSQISAEAPSRYSPFRSSLGSWLSPWRPLLDTLRAVLLDGAQEQVAPGSSASPADGQSKGHGASRFGLFGAQLLQKTVGWMSKSRQVYLANSHPPPGSPPLPFPSSS